MIVRKSIRADFLMMAGRKHEERDWDASSVGIEPRGEMAAPASMSRGEGSGETIGAAATVSPCSISSSVFFRLIRIRFLSTLGASSTAAEDALAPNPPSGLPHDPSIDSPYLNGQLSPMNPFSDLRPIPSVPSALTRLWRQLIQGLLHGGFIERAAVRGHGNSEALELGNQCRLSIPSSWLTRTLSCVRSVPLHPDTYSAEDVSDADARRFLLGARLVLFSLGLCFFS